MGVLVMKLVNLTCPNCGGQLEKVGDNLCCKSCGAAFAIDYDDADVEHEKLQTEDERAKRDFEHEKELLEMKLKQEEKSKVAAEKREFRRETTKKVGRSISAKISGLIFLVLFFGFFYGSYKLMVKNGLVPSFKEIMESATSTRVDQYNSTPDMVTDEILTNMIESGNQKMKNSHNGVNDYVNKKWVDYKIDKIEYDSAYYVDSADRGEDRVVIIYKLTYKSKKDTKVMYDACYFGDFRVDADGNLVTSYSAQKTSKSDAAWHHDSFADRDQCYRESVLSNGGKVIDLTKS